MPPTDRRRAAARRRAWGRGPMILRFERLEDRQLLSTATAALPDLSGAAFDTLHNLDWGATFHATGIIANTGDAAVTTPFKVDFYASPTPGLSLATAVFLGEATVPAGLQPGQTVPVDQEVTLPSTPLSGIGADNTIYINMVVDPQNAVAESSKLNNLGRGQGYDISAVTIIPRQPAALTGASLGVYPDTAQWGQTVKVTTQVHNSGPGGAPPTRARVVLTPLGFLPGGAADITIGNLNVPAVPANQSVVVSQDVTLPAVPPAGFVSASQFTLSVVQDADYALDPIAPHRATQGIGYDMVAVGIAPPADPTASLGPRSDLLTASVLAPSQPISWSQPFQVTATIQNKGNHDAGPYRVRFYLVGANGDLSQGVFLGDANLLGLKAGFGQNVIQTLKFPKLPAGVTVNPQARIAVEVDPENAIDDADRSNNIAVSDVVTLNLVGTDGTVTPVKSPGTATTADSLKPTGTTPTTTPAQTAPAAAGAAAVAARRRQRAAIAAKQRAAKPKHTFEHNLKVFPKHVSSAFYKLIKKL